MPDESVQAAEAAFAQGFEEPAVEQAPAPADTAPDPVEAPGATEEDSFRGFDESVLTNLPPEVAAQLKAERDSMRADYTRKTQAVAEQRKLFEGLDPQLARDSVDYVNRLSTDPAFLVETHSEISKALQQMGLTPNQADAAATQQINEQAYDDDDEAYGSVPPHVEQQLRELQEWKSGVEDERYQTYLANESLKMENAVRQTHPEYTDDDMSYVMQLAWKTGGNLIKADETYQEMKGYFAKQLLGEKASIPSTMTPPPAGGQIDSPVDAKAFGTSLDKAHAAAMEAWRNMTAE